MAEIVKLVYVMIIFLFLFFVVTNIEAIRERCFKDSDCPKNFCRRPWFPNCVNLVCKCVELRVRT